MCDNRRIPQRGFTLVEVLVALVITGMLVSILMGSLYYLFRVEDALRDEIDVRENELRSKAWLSEILGGCLPAAGGSGSEFLGTADEIRCDTSAPLRPQKVLSPRRVTLNLKKGDEGGTILTYSEEGSRAEAVIIARFPEGESRFRYAGTKKSELDLWPPARNDPETLPRRVFIQIRTPGYDRLEWMVAIRAEPWLEPPVNTPFGAMVPR